MQPNLTLWAFNSHLLCVQIPTLSPAALLLSGPLLNLEPRFSLAKTVTTSLPYSTDAG